MIALAFVFFFLAGAIAGGWVTFKYLGKKAEEAIAEMQKAGA
jgi:hypothetical protein